MSFAASHRTRSFAQTIQITQWVSCFFTELRRKVYPVAATYGLVAQPGMFSLVS
ncbi:MAG: hypothetical protein ACR2MF_09640 [Chthoniobacterales bacterium]